MSGPKYSLTIPFWLVILVIVLLLGPVRITGDWNLLLDQIAHYWAGCTIAERQP